MSAMLDRLRSPEYAQRSPGIRLARNPRRTLCVLRATCLSLLSCGAHAAEPAWPVLPGNAEFKTVLAYEDTASTVSIPSFELQPQPVTNAEFLRFVTVAPEWRRGTAPTIFVDAEYLAHWSGPLSLGKNAQADQPVSQVSWFAAQAYCEAQGARLPTWSEWEYAAAADATRVDARQDPAWREAILAWYSKPSGQPLAEVGQAAANVYGVQDLHGLVWEWVDDYAAMLVSADNRDQGDADILKFCGAGALSTNDRENYAVLMRIAMLSALEAVDTTRNVGFRCARDLGGRR